MKKNIIFKILMLVPMLLIGGYWGYLASVGYLVSWVISLAGGFSIHKGWLTYPTAELPSKSRIFIFPLALGMMLGGMWGSMIPPMYFDTLHLQLIQAAVNPFSLLIGVGASMIFIKLKPISKIAG